MATAAPSRKGPTVLAVARQQEGITSTGTSTHGQIRSGTATSRNSGGRPPCVRLHTAEEVTGSIPISPTAEGPGQRLVRSLGPGRLSCSDGGLGAIRSEIRSCSCRRRGRTGLSTQAERSCSFRRRSLWTVIARGIARDGQAAGPRGTRHPGPVDRADVIASSPAFATRWADELARPRSSRTPSACRSTPA
jgi:hypothetical protein